jgi:hypothetical protein
MILLQLHEMFATRQLGEEIGRLEDMRRKSVVRVILSITQMRVKDRLGAERASAKASTCG